MERFATLEGVAAPLLEPGIDTDVIFPGRFLLLMDREGLGEHLFHDRRFDRDGNERPDFILNWPPFRHSRILIAGENFGCGSSREHAVWAVADFGVRCVIAPSFGEIFYANCFKNGVLPISLSSSTCAALAAHAEQGRAFRIDLPAQVVRVDGDVFRFEIDAARRDTLLNGLDEIATTLRDHGDDIVRFEDRLRQAEPWMFP